MCPRVRRAARLLVYYIMSELTFPLGDTVVRFTDSKASVSLRTGCNREAVDFMLVAYEQIEQQEYFGRGYRSLRPTTATENSIIERSSSDTRYEGIVHRTLVAVPCEVEDPPGCHNHGSVPFVFKNLAGCFKGSWTRKTCPSNYNNNNRSARTIILIL